MLAHNAAAESLLKGVDLQQRLICGSRIPPAEVIALEAPLLEIEHFAPGEQPVGSANRVARPAVGKLSKTRGGKQQTAAMRAAIMSVVNQAITVRVFGR